jgi:hypothetical protein
MRGSHCQGDSCAICARHHQPSRITPTARKRKGTKKKKIYKNYKITNLQNTKNKK